MTYRNAQKIVGFSFTMVRNDPGVTLPSGTRPLRPVWVCTGVHPEYGYKVQCWNEQQHLAVKAFVDHNYREIGLVVLREQSHCCIGCGTWSLELQVDHIQMRSHGRLDARLNLRGLCASCHHRRHHDKNWRPMLVSPVQPTLKSAGY